MAKLKRRKAKECLKVWLTSSVTTKFKMPLSACAIYDEYLTKLDRHGTLLYALSKLPGEH